MGRPRNTLEQSLITALAWVRRVQRCKVIGCFEYVSNRRDVCERHYMRLYRHGYDKRPERGRTFKGGSIGYTLEYLPGHFLARKDGMVYQHRRVYYDEHGVGPFSCYWCGREVSWSTLHVDHLNNHPADNTPDNLVASCQRCNNERGQMLSLLKKVAVHWPVEKYRDWALSEIELAALGRPCNNHSIEMAELEKRACKLANTLLSTRIGKTWHPFRREEDRVDMTQPDFDELRKLSKAVLEQAEIQNNSQ